MNINEIEKYILTNFKDILPIDTWGEKSFFLNPGKKLKRGSYFTTLKEKDGQNDQASYLNREGLFRLNIGVTKDCYISLFSNLPERPSKGNFIEGDYDFKKVDKILPHPIYAWMGWVCVTNPSYNTFETCKYLLENAYNKALKITLSKISKNP